VVGWIAFMVVAFAEGPTPGSELYLLHDLTDPTSADAVWTPILDPSAVAVLALRGDRLLVRAPTGAQAWVRPSDLGTAPSRARTVPWVPAPHDPELAGLLRRNWDWGGLAPVDPDALRRAWGRRDRRGEVYPLTDRVDDDRVIGATLDWEPGFRAVGPEWSWYTGRRPSNDPTLSEAAWADFGVSPDLEVWVLPKAGPPAVRARPTRLWVSTPGECGGYFGYALDVDVEGWLAHVGAPPASWMVPPPPVEPAWRSAVEADFAARPPADGADGSHRALVFHGDHAYGRRIEVHPERPDGFGYRHVVVDLVYEQGGPTRGTRFEVDTYAGVDVPAMALDVGGDGIIDVVYTGCATEVVDGAGRSGWHNQNRCCGC
jgi:hypothetical protein